MSTSYHVYKNDGAGGPIDYTTIVATTASLSYDAPAPGANKDIGYAVRAFDTVTGLEETNVDAVVRIITDASGNDITNRPAAPIGLEASANAGGGARLLWHYPPNWPGGQPTGFHVYVGTPTPSYASPALTVPFVPGQMAYLAYLPSTGLVNGTAYQVVVRAYNATAEEPNTQAVGFTSDSTGPLAPISFVGKPSVIPWLPN